jgi:hypothetical protein
MYTLVAVQMPKPRARAEWEKALKWLDRASEGVVTFEDKQSIEAKVPQLLQDSESPKLLQHA